jgi:hypothetical protein
MNKSLMEFTRQDFSWTSLALPFCLLYKAIKMEFHDEETLKEKILKIFGWNDEVTLWRAGKINAEELR